MGAECSKLRQPMRAILALSRAQLLLIVVTRSRDLSRECHVTKHKTPARSNFPMSNFENFGTIQFSSSRSTSRGLCPKNFEKRAHPTVSSVSIQLGQFGVSEQLILCRCLLRPMCPVMMHITVRYLVRLLRLFVSIISVFLWWMPSG